MDARIRIYKYIAREQHREEEPHVVTATFKGGGDNKNGDRQINHALSLWLSMRLHVCRLQPSPLHLHLSLTALPPPPREELYVRALTYFKVLRESVATNRKREGMKKEEGRKSPAWKDLA